MGERTLSELIHLYNNCQTEKESPEAKNLYDEIASQIMIICYYMPQTMLKLSEEHACEFAFYMQKKMKWIIENYRKDCDDFNSYIFPLLRYNLKYFFYFKRKVENKESAVIYGNSVSEYILNTDETDCELFVSEENRIESVPLNRLRFVMQQSHVCRRRFFVYLLSFARQVGISELNLICRELCYDFSETLKIFNIVKVICREFDQREKQLTLRRNYYWRKYLVNEAELTKRKYYNDFSDIEKITESSSEAIYYRDLRNDELNKVKNQVKYETISKLLNLSLGTVSSAIFYSKNLSLWSLSGKFGQNCSCLGVGSRLFEKMLDYDIDTFSGKPASVFHPYSEFSVMSYESDNCTEIL